MSGLVTAEGLRTTAVHPGEAQLRAQFLFLLQLWDTWLVQLSLCLHHSWVMLGKAVNPSFWLCTHSR